MPNKTSISPTRLLPVFLIVLTALRFVAAGLVEWSPDEALQVMCAERPDWSYDTFGPLPVLATRVGVELFGGTTWAVRWFAPLAALAASWLVFRLAAELFGRTSAFWTVLMVNALPVFQTHAVRTHPGSLAVMFGLLLVWGVWRAVHSGGWTNILCWLCAGLGAAGMFLCDPAAWWSLLPVAAYLAVTRGCRREFIRPGFWLFVLIFAAGLYPVLRWYSDHEWVALSRLQTQGYWHAWVGFHPGTFWNLVSRQALELSWPGAVLVLATLPLGWQLAGRHTRPRYLLVFILGSAGAGIFGALLRNSLLSSTGLFSVLACVFCTGIWREHRMGEKLYRVWGTGTALAVAVAGFLALPTGWPWPGGVAAAGWRTTTEAVETVRRQYESVLGENVFLIADSTDLAAALSGHLTDPRREFSGHPAVYLPESQNIDGQFAYWPRYDAFVSGALSAGQETSYFTEQKGVNPFMGRTALFVTSSSTDRPPQNIRSAFGSCEKIAQIEIFRGRAGIRFLHVFACHDYQTLSL